MKMTLENKNITIVTDERSELATITLVPIGRPEKDQVIEANLGEIVVLYNLLHVMVNSIDNRGLLP